MFRDPRITVLVETEHPDGRPGICRDCGHRILWFTTSPKGRMMPFDPNPMVLSVTVNSDTRVRFKVLSSESLHFANCPNRGPRAAHGAHG